MKLPNDMVKRVTSEFENIDLGDPRRDKRIVMTVGKMAQKPNRTVPEAMGGEASLEGAYRIVNNQRVTFEMLGGEHVAKTRERAEAAGAVLVLHDTSTCQFGHAEAEKIGYLPTGKAGFYLHCSLVVDTASWRRPLGVIAAETLHRRQRTRRKKTSGKYSGAETAQWKDRESQRWWRGIDKSAERLRGCPDVIHVADREGDSYELLARMANDGLRHVIRVKHNRAACEANEDTQEWSSLKTLMAGAEGRIEREVPLWARKGKSAPRAAGLYPPRRARVARLRFSAKTVQIRQPYYTDKSLPAPLELNVVHVTEIAPPEGEPAVEWLLYTTEPIDTPKQVERIVDNYRLRWLIEEFFASLKTGCLYEQRQFESTHALLNILALLIPIACQLLWLRSRARTTPDAPATEVITPRQIRILRVVGPRPLSKDPTAAEVMLVIAELGGHKKSNGPPGWRILQRGMTTLQDYEIGWAAARERG